jgi:hypothetical protein
MRDPSQGMSSTIANSQGDLNFHEVNIGSGSNISDYERVIKSAALKYRHMIPNTEAIEEEEAPENVTRTGMFKRNANYDEEDNQERTKSKANDYIYESVGGVQRQDSLQLKILSGTA